MVERKADTVPKMPETNLVYDVGMHVATDSAYYLRRGYDVVAVEANPVLAEEGRRRFRSECEAGRFTVLNVGVAESEGEADFWICDDWTAWSSFDRRIASRNGNAHHAVRVQLCPMRRIVEKHGLPYYCKVDIEGHDRYCLDGFTADFRPGFLSVEFSNHPFIDRMRDLGYDRFKLIHQLSFSPPSARERSLRSLVPHPKLRAGLERVRGLFAGALTDGTWYFKVGSSGPLPWDTPGPWLTYEQAVSVQDRLRSQFKSGKLTLFDSFDVHATTVETLSSLE